MLQIEESAIRTYINGLREEYANRVEDAMSRSIDTNEGFDHRTPQQRATESANDVTSPPKLHLKGLFHSTKVQPHHVQLLIHDHPNLRNEHRLCNPRIANDTDIAKPTASANIKIFS